MSITSTQLHYPVSQIAYFVPDVRAAAKAHAELFGSGPYYVIDSVFDCLHRGKPMALDHSAAYGQWGELMIEFIQQNDDRPSVLHDLYAPGSSGLHHVALIVDQLESAIERFAAEGMEIANYAQVGEFSFAMMDGVERYGHFIELYEATPLIRQLYDTVRDAARDFDGRELIRPLVL